MNGSKTYRLFLMATVVSYLGLESLSPISSVTKVFSVNFWTGFIDKYMAKGIAGKIFVMIVVTLAGFLIAAIILKALNRKR
jgi:hypothetical protein